MDFYYRHCDNCGGEYRWMASGWKHDKDESTHQYCGECGGAVKKALALISKKTELQWVKTSEVTLDELLESEKLKEIACIERGGIPVSRVFVGLHCEKLGGWQVIDEVEYKDHLYQYKYYPFAKDDAEILKRVRVDCLTGEEC